MDAAEAKALEAQLRGFVQQSCGHPAVTLVGEADRSNVDSARGFLHQALGMGSHITLDLSGLSFTDAGLPRLLLEALSLLPATGRLTIANPSEGVRRVLEISGVTRDHRVRVE